MKTKAARERRRQTKAIKRQYGYVEPEMVRKRLEERHAGAYDPDSFIHWFDQFAGASGHVEEYGKQYDVTLDYQPDPDRGMERETVQRMRPKFARWLREAPKAKRAGRRRH